MAPKEKQKIEIEKTHGDPLLSFNQAVTVDCPDFLGTALIFRLMNMRILRRSKEGIVNKVVYISKSHIERREGPLRIADLPGESMPVIFSVHGAIAEHYKIDPAKLTESHSSTIDYVISATAG